MGTPWRLLAAASAVALLAVVAGCGGEDAQDIRYQAVPESAWPAIQGVDVVRAHSADGNSCCEAYEGSLTLRLDLPDQHPYAALRAGLRDDGWKLVNCGFPHQDGNLYVVRDGLWGWANTNRVDTGSADLFVFVERAGPATNFDPPGCR
jgi:hypothetical protein